MLMLCHERAACAASDTRGPQCKSLDEDVGVPYKWGSKASSLGEQPLKDCALSFPLPGVPVADEGVDVMHNGNLAASLAAEIQAAGGVVTEADLASVQPQVSFGSCRYMIVESIGMSAKEKCLAVQWLAVLIYNR